MNELITWRLEDVPPEHAVLVLGILAGVGALYCFFGYRLLKLILGLTGFLLAGSTAAVLVGFLSYGNVPAMAVAVFIGGLCGAMALFFLYKTGIFCVGMLGAVVVAYQILQGRPEPWILWAVAGLGLMGGFLAILIERPIMTLASAAIGALMMTQVGLTPGTRDCWRNSPSKPPKRANDCPIFPGSPTACWPRGASSPSSAPCFNFDWVRKNVFRPTPDLRRMAYAVFR